MGRLSVKSVSFSLYPISFRADSTHLAHMKQQHLHFLQAVVRPSVLRAAYFPYIFT